MSTANSPKKRSFGSVPTRSAKSMATKSVASQRSQRPLVSIKYFAFITWVEQLVSAT